MTQQRETYCYLRDDKRRPLITICKIHASDGRIGYGWAICGPDDRPQLDDTQYWDGESALYRTQRGGRSIARGRAEAALKGGKRSVLSAYHPMTYVYSRPVMRLEALQVADACQACDIMYNLSCRHNPLMLPKHMLPYIERDHDA